MAAPVEPSGDALLDSPSPPQSPDELDLPTSPLSPELSLPFRPAPPGPPTISTANMATQSPSLGGLSAARGVPSPRTGPTIPNADIMARMKAFQESRQHTPTLKSPGAGFAPGIAGPTGRIPPKPVSLADRRSGMKLPGGLPGATPLAAGAAGAAPASAAPARKQKPKMSLSQIVGGQTNGDSSATVPAQPQSQMDVYKEYVDTKAGALTFKGKAVVHGSGIEFASGRSFSISLDEVDTLDELGKGNYGTVYKVRHARPKFRRQNQGLAGIKSHGDEESPTSPTRSGGTGVVMAMKEMRLELDDAKFQTVIMELDVLHRCISPYIIDFYGAFFQEGAVYICMEFMDGSIDKLYGDGIPEEVLRRITTATVLGLKCLKEEHNIIHRDVKPTNILVNTRGQVKICDFGVSGNLVASIAKTKIGCQSYMAPERISSGGGLGVGPGSGTYGVQSDIWSLGLSVIECAMGRYPYPPETYDNIFSQLSAIVDGDPPDLPASFSAAAHDFVAGCLNKIPKLRPTYPMLLQHAWIAPLAKPKTIMEEDEDAEPEATVDTDAPAPFYDKIVGEWAIAALDRRARGIIGNAAKPALHAAPLDAIPGGPTGEVKAAVALGV